MPWDELKALSGWVGMVAVVVLLALTERFRRVFVTRSDFEDAIESESEDRKTADRHQDMRVADIAQDLHNYMGKLDLLKDSLGDMRLSHQRELGDLRTEIRTGFAELKAAINHRRKEEN
jgi:DNA repair exonuclease SbcCD ATPase subunit